MPKLNNKGLTLVELIISVVLIVIVMFFMYRLLNDVNAEKNDNNYAQENSLNRGEIIKEVEEDMFGKTITAISANKSGSNLVLNMTLTNKENNISQNLVITISNKEFKYKISSVKERKWTMKNATLNTAKITVKYTENSATNTYSLLLLIPVYTDNDANRECNHCSNNVVDDIIISHMADGSIPALRGKTCLGQGC